MEYVTLQEGARLTGKSEMTIRRLTKRPGARPNTRKDADQRLYISLSFLYKHYPAKEGLIAVTKTFGNEPKQDATPVLDAAISSTDAKAQPIQTVQPTHESEAEAKKDSNPDFIAILQQQNQELKTDKQYLQTRLEEVSKQLSREQERTNYLLLQQSTPKPDQEQDQQSQAPAKQGTSTVDRVLIAAILLLAAALATVMLLK